jgi:PAS domain S-box-containing protein
MALQTDTSLTRQRRNDLLKNLYVISSMLKQVEADDLDINAVLSGILKVAIKQLNAREDMGTIFIMNQDGEIEHAWINNPKANKVQAFQVSRDLYHHGIASWVIRKKRADLIKDTMNDDRWKLPPGYHSRENAWSVICAPVIIRNHAVGTITLERLGTDKFDNRDLNLLAAISSQAASSIENALLFEESQRQLRISDLLNEASRIINSSLDIDEVMKALLAQMNEPLNAEATSIALVDNRTNELVYQAAEGIGGGKIVGLRLPANQGLSGWVMQHGEPALVPDTSNDPRFTQLGDKITGHPTRAMICAPIQFKDEVLGTIQAINPVEGTFTRRDLNLLSRLASIASTAVANAQQYARAQAANRRYLNLFQDSVNPIVLTDMKRRIVEANRRALQFFGYKRDDLIGRSIKDLFPDEFKLPKARKISDQIQSFKTEAYPIEGQPIPVEVHAKRATFTDDVELLQWLYHDISQQVELEQMRQDLMAMLFHDLQSPLGNVISSLELMQFEIPPEATESSLAMMLDIAYRSSQHLQSLISSLLDIDRLEAGHPVGEREPISMSQVIDEVTDIEKPDLDRRRINLIHQLDDNMPDVFIQKDMIRRVITNLVDNAVRYSNGGKEITIQAQNIADMGLVKVSVIDQGPGVPERYREAIFEKFQRVHKGRETKGLGIGLAFCRLAVEAHNGRIWVDDAPGGGASFNFTLPIVKQYE